MNEKFLRLSQEKQENILQAAISEFAEAGYDRASTDNIVAKAKISKGSLFNYFINKQGLYEDVVNYAITKVKKEVVGQLLEIKEKDFYGRLKRLLVIKHRYILQYPLEVKVLRDYLNNSMPKDNTIVKKYRALEKKYIQEHLITYLDVELVRKELQVEDVLFATNTLLQAVLERQEELAFFDQEAGKAEIVERELDKYIYLLRYGIHG